MKKLLIGMLLVSMLVSVGMTIDPLTTIEDYGIPRDANGRTPADVNLVGVQYTLLSDNTAVVVSTRPVVVYGAILAASTNATTNYLILSDSTTTTTIATEQFLPNLIQDSTSVIKVITFPEGIATRQGLAVQLSGSGLQSGAVLWRYRRYLNR